MSKKNCSNPARRRLLRAVGASGGILAANGNLPARWSRPVIDTVVLPGHAQATGTYYAVIQRGVADAKRPSGGIWDSIVSPSYADAGFEEAEIHLCVTPNGNSALMELAFLRVPNPDAGVLYAGMIPIGGPTTALHSIAAGQGCKFKEFIVQAEIYSLAKGAIFFEGGALEIKFDLPMVPCNLPGLGECLD
jgi:hypothetical protein